MASAPDLAPGPESAPVLALAPESAPVSALAPESISVSAPAPELAPVSALAPVGRFPRLFLSVPLILPLSLSPVGSPVHLLSGLSYPVQQAEILVCSLICNAARQVQCL
ncbi:hypothetical protein ROHU_031849 [Labeo rohita]|uniref:Uncharacterized protein n=1 Tax=Labeo rohita TaxID=84645 RepID=A0A498LSK3_LABRO|nr:hypothetical protein ROHU_031849 [Labeo rohita]